MATYAGPLEILGANNAPGLDEIAWYGGNSGLDFELENGWDSSSWPEKQYDRQRAGSHPVARKTCNAWGLYDMLGNVWEWCQDGLRRYTAESVNDPVGSTDRGADRVLRGGCWLSNARRLRCAIRLEPQPGFRNVIVGFRPARVQQPEAQASGDPPAAEPAGPALGRKGGARPTQDQPSGAVSRKKRRRRR